MARLEQLQELLNADPADSFLRYGVAMEYAKARDFPNAMAEFNELLRRDPDYVAAYFMAGRACEQQGDVPAAKQMYQRGIEVGRKVGDTHATGEISEALAALE